MGLISIQRILFSSHDIADHLHGLSASNLDDHLDIILRLRLQVGLDGLTNGRRVRELDRS